MRNKGTYANHNFCRQCCKWVSKEIDRCSTCGKTTRKGPKKKTNVEVIRN